LILGAAGGEERLGNGGRRRSGRLAAAAFGLTSLRPGREGTVVLGGWGLCGTVLRHWTAATSARGGGCSGRTARVERRRAVRARPVEHGLLRRVWQREKASGCEPAPSEYVREPRPARLAGRAGDGPLVHGGLHGGSGLAAFPAFKASGGA
jgi:hypothetical protein